MFRRFIHRVTSQAKLTHSRRTRRRRQVCAIESLGTTGRTRMLEQLEPRQMLTTTVSPVFAIGPDSSPVADATSTLVRSGAAISVSIDTVNLEPGVYIVTALAFNNPEHCEGQCDEGDFNREGVGASLLFGDGQVVGETGEATFDFQIKVGDASQALIGPGITDSQSAEIRFNIATHGAVIPDQLEEQLTTIDGGCDVNACGDIQTSLHMSPRSTVTVRQFLTFSDHLFTPIDDSVSRLTRYDDHVALSVDTVELAPGAYTVWVVAFNNWEACDVACVPEDLMRPEVNASVMYGAGGVVDESGIGTFRGIRYEGDMTNTALIGGPGIVDAYTSELHLVVRYHGPVIPEILDGQIGTFEGGCDVFECEDVQVSPHPAVPRPALLLETLDVTASGFVLEFNTGIDAGVLSIFDTELGNHGAADLVVEGQATGPVQGSLVVGPSPGRVTFIKTGGPLVPDTYSVTLRSAADAFRNTAGGLLESNEVGVGASDLTGSFVVEPPSDDAITVSVPDFVRGPGQEANLPADSSDGIPILLSETAGVAAVELWISYDPSMLEIQGVDLGTAMPAEATVSLNTETPGTAILTFSSPIALASGMNALAHLRATVPSSGFDEKYLGRHILDVHSVAIRDPSDNEISVIADDAVHLNAYFADVSGNGFVNGSDAARLARVAALLDAGLESMPAVDPLIVADISGDGRVNASDASLVAQFAALLEVPRIPVIPDRVQALRLTAGNSWARVEPPLQIGALVDRGPESEADAGSNVGTATPNWPATSLTRLGFAVDQVMLDVVDRSENVVTESLEDAIRQLWEHSD